ncbi:uncharacterized protein LOC119720377 [Patiria miniata]|uniref:THAP-type domain-containing protein n=1 Tax=Patiria miniata TaxID=46514 RepID=A0A913Z5C4_PATMI|nr:uncharacterized protein LOC119720377 [Patiria miniata]
MGLQSEQQRHHTAVGKRTHGMHGIARCGVYDISWLPIFLTYCVRWEVIIVLFWVAIMTVVIHKDVIKEHVNTLGFHSCRHKKLFPLWTQLTQRQDFKVKSSTTVCSNHFKYGQPYPDELHPSLFLRGYDLPETLKRAPVKSRALDLTTPLPAI